MSKNSGDMKYRLWAGGNLTAAGQLVEKYLRAKLTRLNFQIVCKNCYRSIKNSQTCFEKKIGMFEEGRLKSVEYVRRTVKRRALNSPSKEENANSQRQRKKRQRLNFDCDNDGTDPLRNILVSGVDAGPSDLKTTVSNFLTGF